MPFHKPVLFSRVISSCIGLPDLGCQDPNDIHKKDKVKLSKREWGEKKTETLGLDTALRSVNQICNCQINVYNKPSFLSLLAGDELNYFRYKEIKDILDIFRTFL